MLLIRSRRLSVMTADSRKGGSPGNSIPVEVPWSCGPVPVGWVEVGTAMCFLYPGRLPTDDLELPDVITEGDGSYLRLKV